jgi:hypothetical protein
VASAINNAISRVGQPIVAALIFIVVSGAFYAALASHVPGVDANSASLRSQVQPLNPPAASVPAAVVSAAREASTDAFHLAALVSAGLLTAGAAVNYLGLRGDPSSMAEAAAATPEAAAGG